MMYGFGDDMSPDPESVALLEEITVKYIIEMVRVIPTHTISLLQS